MPPSRSIIEPDLGGSGGNDDDVGGGGGTDAEWLSSLSEPHLDFLISLKELVRIRATTIGHKQLADLFDVKMLRSLGIVLLEYFKEHAPNAHTSNLAETLALFSVSASASQTRHESNKDMQTPSFITSRRRRLWEGVSQERPSSKRQKTSKSHLMGSGMTLMALSFEESKSTN